MFIEAVGEIPHSKKFQLVASIQSTIPHERIRIQLVQEKPKEMWGFVWLNRLPFVFRAWSSIARTRLEFLSNGMDVYTRWKFVHAPQNPLDFQNPIFTEPMSDDDFKYMLIGLKLGRKRINTAKKKGVLRDLFKQVLLVDREEDYHGFQDLYFKNDSLRLAYGAAVSMVCDEKQKALVGL